MKTLGIKVYYSIMPREKWLHVDLDWFPECLALGCLFLLPAGCFYAWTNLRFDLQHQGSQLNIMEPRQERRSL